MLGDTIIMLRKKQALSQQQLADRMHVVRQTVSKWEKNLSVPDADALVRLADALDVTVPELLGQPAKEEPSAGEYAAVLAQINEQLAIQNRRRSRVWKVIAWVLGIVLAANILLILSAALFTADENLLSSMEDTEIVMQQDIDAQEDASSED